MNLEPAIHPNPNVPQANSPVWKWNRDGQWETYGVGQQDMAGVQKTIETMYQKHVSGASVSTFTLTLVRLNNKMIDTYQLDFSVMKQTNMRTAYLRDICRNLV